MGKKKAKRLPGVEPAPVSLEHATLIHGVQLARVQCSERMPPGGKAGPRGRGEQPSSFDVKLVVGVPSSQLSVCHIDPDL